MAFSSAPVAAARDRGDGTTRRLRATLLTIAAALALFGGGFVWFAASVPRQEGAGSRPAEAIVVLTGGADRIADAVELLAAGRAARLLITGVHPDTTSEEIARRIPLAAPYLACCIDLDRRALNTAGNAVEARRWVHANGFHRVIVVTSAWHMRRALVELGRALPEVELIAYPVVPPRPDGEPWWRDGEQIRLLFTEYLKYLAAVLEVRLGPRTADTVSPDPVGERPDGPA
jgi:uncharacterized SAM-binding protein YcdF (DUF218 family)